MTRSSFPVMASGDFFVIGGRVSLSKDKTPDFRLAEVEHASGQGQAEGWQLGAATFSSTPKVMASIQKYLQEGKSQLGEGERAKSFTPAAARFLFPGARAHDAKIGLNPEIQSKNNHRRNRGNSLGLYTERWFYRPAESFALVEGLAKVSVVECLVLRDSVQNFKPVDPSFCVVIVHLEGRNSDANQNLRICDASSVRDLATAVHEHVQTAKGRKSTLESLQKFIGRGFDFSPLSGDRENSAICYPVFTLLDLKAKTDQDVLAVRELSTMTPSARHGSTNYPEERIMRARKEITNLSDEWGGSITSHGAVFFSLGKERYDAAPLYVSAIYADAIAATFLTRLVLNQIENDAYEELRRETMARNYTENLEQLLILRRRLLLVNRALGGLHKNESRTIKAIVSVLRRNLHSDEQEESAAQGIRDLVDTLGLQRDLAHAEEFAREAREAQLTNVFLASIGIFAIPPTLLFTVFEIFRNYPAYQTWTWVGVIVWTLALVCTIFFMWRRKWSETGRSALDD